MKNYKAMKSAKSWSVKKAKVVDSKASSVTINEPVKGVQGLDERTLEQRQSDFVEPSQSHVFSRSLIRFVR